jgi:hypothetical protein
MREQVTSKRFTGPWSTWPEEQSGDHPARQSDKVAVSGTLTAQTAERHHNDRTGLMTFPNASRLTMQMLTALGVWAGCHSSPPSYVSKDAGIPQAVDIAEFCALAVPAYCAHLARCRPADAREPPNECLSHQGPDWCARIVTPGGLASVQAGRMYWYSIQAGQCIDDLAATACRTSRVYSQCSARNLIGGLVEAGGTCVFESSSSCDCRVGYCQSTQPCQGTCSQVLGQGEGCPGLFGCAGGLHCINPSTGADCGTSAGCTCQPALRWGDPCSSDTNAPPCDPGLVCLGGRCGQQRLGEGQTCKSHNDCEGDLACLAGPTGSICGLRRAAGGDCVSIEDCKAGLTCRFDGHCGPFVMVEQFGEDCKEQDSLVGGGDCGLGYSCSTIGCRKRQTAFGADCGLDHLYCFGRDLQCLPGGGLDRHNCQLPASVGASCMLECASPDLRCVSGKCALRAAIGDACADDEQCASGNCFAGQCSDSCLGP